MKPYARLLVLATTVVAGHSLADESLESCSNAKIRQMQLQQSIKAEMNRAPAIYNQRRNHPDPVAMQQEENKLEEWLWKSCRNYSNELRSIEQQYM